MPPVLLVIPRYLGFRRLCVFEIDIHILISLRTSIISGPGKTDDLESRKNPVKIIIGSAAARTALAGFSLEIFLFSPTELQVIFSSENGLDLALSSKYEELSNSNQWQGSASDDGGGG